MRLKPSNQRSTGGEARVDERSAHGARRERRLAVEPTDAVLGDVPVPPLRDGETRHAVLHQPLELVPHRGRKPVHRAAPPPFAGLAVLGRASAAGVAAGLGLGLGRRRRRRRRRRSRSTHRRKTSNSRHHLVEVGANGAELAVDLGLEGGELGGGGGHAGEERPGLPRLVRPFRSDREGGRRADLVAAELGGGENGDAVLEGGEGGGRVGVEVHDEAGVWAVLLAHLVGENEESSPELGHEAQLETVRAELPCRGKHHQSRGRSTEVETSQRGGGSGTSRIAISPHRSGVEGGRVGGVVGDDRRVGGELPHQVVSKERTSK